MVNLDRRDKESSVTLAFSNNDNSPLTTKQNQFLCVYMLLLLLSVL